jgi:hypothetical protein
MMLPADLKRRDVLRMIGLYNRRDHHENGLRGGPDKGCLVSAHFTDGTSRGRS